MTAEEGRGRPPAPWRVAPDLVWTHYDDGDDWVVYSPASADIHHLTDSAHQLWTLVSSGSFCTADDLGARLAADLGHPFDVDFATATGETLAFMDRVGLIYPASS